MDDKELECALDGCDRTFVPSVHNQRFCSPEHTKIYTNKRILEQYHEKKNRDLRNRVCSQQGCNTVLSIYNPDDICGAHQHKRLMDKLSEWGRAPDEDFEI